MSDGDMSEVGMVGVAAIHAVDTCWLVQFRACDPCQLDRRGASTHACAGRAMQVIEGDALTEL